MLLHDNSMFIPSKQRICVNKSTLQIRSVSQCSCRNACKKNIVAKSIFLGSYLYVEYAIRRLTTRVITILTNRTMTQSKELPRIIRKHFRSTPFAWWREVINCVSLQAWLEHKTRRHGSGHGAITIRYTLACAWTIARMHAVVNCTLELCTERLCVP